jgi:hypothetical protein
MRFKSYLSKITLAASVALVLGFQSCQKAPQPAIVSTENGTIEAYEHTKVVDGKQLDVTTVSAQGLVLRGSQTALATIKVGDVLVAPVLPNAPQGFLRKVKTISISGDIATLTTDEAALNDALKTANIHIKRQVAPEVVSDRASSFTKTFDEVLFDADGNTATTYDRVRLEGSAAFTPTMSMDIDISWGSITYFNAGVNFAETLNTKLTAGGTIPFNVSREVYNQNLSPFTVWIGWFPIVITPQVIVTIGANGAATAVVVANFTATANQNAYIRYQNNAWTNGGSRTLTTAYNYNGTSVSVNAKGYVEPQLKFKLYGFDGANARIMAQGYLLLNASLYPTAGCSLKGGVSAGAGAQLWSIASVSYPELLKYETTLYTCQ